MHILHSLLNELNEEFSESKQGKERRVWFMYTLLAIILPFTSSRTSNLLRALKALFGFTYIGKKRYYTFMGSPKIPWNRLWELRSDQISTTLGAQSYLKVYRKKFAAGQCVDLGGNYGPGSSTENRSNFVVVYGK